MTPFEKIRFFKLIQAILDLIMHYSIEELQEVHDMIENWKLTKNRIDD